MKKLEDMEEQYLFNLDDPQTFAPSITKSLQYSVKKKRKLIDYESLYQLLLSGPLTFAQIEEAAGVSHNAVAQVITTLSLRYPLWSPSRGVYKLCEASDYVTVNRTIKDDDDD